MSNLFFVHFTIHIGVQVEGESKNISLSSAPEVLFLAREDHNSLHREVVRHGSPASWTLCAFHAGSCWKVEVGFLTEGPGAPRRTECSSLCVLFSWKTKSPKIFDANLRF